MSLYWRLVQNQTSIVGATYAETMPTPTASSNLNLKAVDAMMQQNNEIILGENNRADM